MDNYQFDTVIVGAGSAGCVLANRLSADPDHSLCLVEAGPRDNSFLIRLPAGILALMWDPRHNWKYYTEPEPFLNNRRLYCPRGKVLGGSSSINAMCFTRGWPEDFDQWSSDGARGWSWNDLLPHFIATQKQLRPGMDPQWHGYDGEQMTADTHHTVDPLSLDFIRAALESGVVPETDDFNGGVAESAGLYQVYQNGKARRVSSADAFLHPVSHRSNLTVLPRMTVQRIRFDGKKAIGLEVMVKGRPALINAEREVILSAGAINSPHLLMHSGIGDAGELAQHNINSLHHLPGVGKNLQDHLDVIINTKIKGYNGIGISVPGLFKGAVDVVKYVVSRKGALTSNGAEAGGFFKTDPSLSTPDVQMHFAPVLLQSHTIRTVGHGHSLHLCNLRPKSRGSVGIRSGDSTDSPVLQFNYIEHPDDLEVMVKAVKTGRKILSAPALQRWTKCEHTPGPDVQTDEEVREFIRSQSETIYHPVGTCKMGKDPMAVVDDDLRVHGLENLRVVDASIMPNINSGNTHASVIAIADKAAEIITSGR